MHRYYNHVSHDDLLRTTRALLKFCREHDYGEAGLANIQACETALAADDFRQAIGHFDTVSLGGDWFPPVVFEHENGEYVWAVFEALMERWVRLMQTAAGRS